MCIHETLCRTFENRVAVYLEKGIILCRISNIRANPDEQYISADTEEIPTIGLGVGAYPTRGEQDLQRPKAMCWKIGAGFMTTFSQDHWAMGYGGWTLYFHPHVIEGVVSLAAHWPKEVNDSFARYRLIIEWFENHDEHLGHREGRRVFQDQQP